MEIASQIPKPMLTCWPVLTEVAWLLQDPRAVLALLKIGTISCLEFDAAAGPWMSAYAAKYASLRPQLADLALCYLAERDGIQQIFTLDQRDFTVYRRGDGRAFELLPIA
jgi:predicted nucleic acid-binding protein